MPTSKTQSHENAQKVNWQSYVGQRCDFLRPGVVSAVVRPHKTHAWEQGIISGTNGEKGILEAVVITDMAGNKVFIPISVAVSSIIFIGEGNFNL